MLYRAAKEEESICLKAHSFDKGRSTNEGGEEQLLLLGDAEKYNFP